MAWNEGIDGVHLKIAEYPQSPLRVVAGPGTGKTFAMMRRIARLLEGGTPPSEILAVSFTRTAANDLVDKLLGLGIVNSGQVQAKTLHSLCFSILSNNAVFDATGRTARPLMQFEEDCLVADLAKAFGGIRETRKALFGFEAAWATLQSMEAGWPQGDKEKAFDRELKSWLIFHGAILVGELIPLTLSYIRANPASPLAPKFSFVLADEYQDLNKADQQLVDAFAREGMLTVIGDEDQSIYSFRFAHPEGISQFQIDHNGTHDEVLDVCRRCPKTIVSMANSLISKNRRSKKSLLKPFDSAPNGEVYLVQHNSENDEVKALAAFIDFYLKRDTNVKPGEILVLANRRIIGYAIRDELMAIGRQAVSFFQEQSLEEAIAIEGYAVLTLLATPTDGPALRAYLGLAKPDWWTNIYGRVRSAAIQESMSVFDFLEAVSIGNKPCPSYCQEMVNRFSVLHTRLDALKGKQLQELIDSLWPAASTECAEIRGLALIAMEKTNSVEELLGELRQLVTQPELPSADGDSIRIMSLHKSKGLTSRCAIIAGANAGVIPNIDPSLSGETLLRDLEEQRRLMYVSMTRATETLVISYTAKMSLKNAMKMKAMVTRNIGAEVLVQASPFLSELGKDAPTPISGATWSRNLGFLLAP